MLGYVMLGYVAHPVRDCARDSAPKVWADGAKCDYLPLGAGHPLVAAVVGLAGRALAPDHHADAGVREHQHEQGRHVLQAHQGHAVVVTVLRRRPLLATDVPAHTQATDFRGNASLLISCKQ